MAKIELYYKPGCPFCAKAKALFDKKSAVINESIDIMQNPERRAEMIERSGGRQTVPQIFINNLHIGGCDDLYALEAQGKLDALLEAS